mmetsp:Transcript_105332/g.250755  ORF Transcript_105332/g.250755 Transcript_105332/m.250755 type:complete len:390 (-) Transcript_105332:929-2098(-)
MQGDSLHLLEECHHYDAFVLLHVLLGVLGDLHVYQHRVDLLQHDPLLSHHRHWHLRPGRHGPTGGGVSGPLRDRAEGPGSEPHEDDRDAAVGFCPLLRDHDGGSDQLRGSGHRRHGVVLLLQLHDLHLGGAHHELPRHLYHHDHQLDLSGCPGRVLCDLFALRGGLHQRAHDLSRSVWAADARLWAVYLLDGQRCSADAGHDHRHIQGLPDAGVLPRCSGPDFGALREGLALLLLPQKGPLRNHPEGLQPDSDGGEEQVLEHVLQCEQLIRLQLPRGRVAARQGEADADAQRFGHLNAGQVCGSLPAHPSRCGAPFLGLGVRDFRLRRGCVGQPAPEHRLRAADDTLLPVPAERADGLVCRHGRGLPLRAHGHLRAALLAERVAAADLL